MGLAGRVRKPLDKLANFLARRVLNSPFEATSASTRAGLVALYTQYRTAALSGGNLPPIQECGLRVFSQTDEDGILLRIFGAIGMGTQTFVEFGCADGLENNTANLCLNFGWHGFMADADPASIARARQFHETAWNATSWLYRPVIGCHMVSPENADTLILEAGLRGSIDLLSIDIDSTDYWVWKAIKSVRPRVVVMEVNPAMGDRSLVVPYPMKFTRAQHPDYYGASLAAYTALGCSLGYKLVALNRLGFNAFFVERDLGGDNLPEVALPLPLKHPYALEAEKRFSQLEQYPLQSL